MKTWKDISLYKFQQIEWINGRSDIDDLDKVCWITCEVFGLTEYELNEMKARIAAKKMRAVVRLMESRPEGEARKCIGPYEINYDPAAMTLGQFVELRHFLECPIAMGHLALASIASIRGEPYISDGHILRADYFLRQPVLNLMASLKEFAERFNEFIGTYNSLFGLDKDMFDQGQQVDRFNKQYGWIYSATVIAEHERITLDQAFGIPIRQAFNDLIYLKAKGRYEAEQHKLMMEKIKNK